MQTYIQRGKRCLHMAKAEFKMKSGIIRLPGSKESFSVIKPVPMPK